MAKKTKTKIKFEFVKNHMRDRVDMDYESKLDHAAHKYLKKFVEEVYGRKFTSRPLHKKRKQRKEIFEEDYSAKQDVFHVCVRVHIDPAVVDIRPTLVRDKLLDPKEKPAPEIESVYIENGVTVTRYKPVKP